MAGGIRTTPLTFVNDLTGCAVTLPVSDDGIVSARSVRRARRELKPPPGADCGWLGEHGPQWPPEVPGVRYETMQLAGGAVQARPVESRNLGGPING